MDTLHETLVVLTDHTSNELMLPVSYRSSEPEHTDG